MAEPFFSPKEYLSLNKQLMWYPHRQRDTEKVYALTLAKDIANGQILANSGTNVPFVQEATQLTSVSRKCPQPTYNMAERQFKKAVTPVKCQRILLEYPDRQKAHMLIHGFKDGFILLIFFGARV